VESHAPTPQVLDLPRHLLRAQEQERKRISRELHDETGQGLMLLRLYLEMLANNSESRKSYLKVQEALDLLDRTIGDLRRIIARLSPRILEEMGLLAAIRKEARELCKHTGLRARLELPKSLGEIPHEIEVALYRLVQEALHNIAKHAKATNFLVRLEFDHWGARLFVEDDGMGFSRGSGSSSKSFGIAGMRERIAAFGGHVRIRSRKGRGTQLKVLLPVSTVGTRRKRSDGFFDQKREEIGTSAKVYRPKKGSTRISALEILKSDVQHANVH